MENTYFFDPFSVVLQALLLIGFIFILYYLIKLYRKIVKYLDKNSK